MMVLIIFCLIFTPFVTSLNGEDKSELHFIERLKDKRKGDIGDLTLFQNAPQNNLYLANRMQVHRRRKRFISFPTGSTLVVRNAISFLKYNDFWHTIRLGMGIPIALRLPPGPLRIIGKKKDVDYDQEEVSYEEYYSNKRSLGGYRKTAFLVIENALENLGLPGKFCLKKAVCEAADEPMESLGILGELLTMLLSPGYGDGVEDMEEFIEAEEVGRNEGECQDLFNECPIHLADFLLSAMSLFHNGLVSASEFNFLSK